MTSNVSFSMSVFGMFAVLGPLIQYVAAQTSLSRESKRASDFVYDLVLLLWPTWPLAAYESMWGVPLAGLVSITANVLLFVAVGAVLGATAGKRSVAIPICASVCCFVVLVAFWGAGFELKFLSPTPLVVALLLYLVPMVMVLIRAENLSEAKSGRLPGLH